MPGLELRGWIANHADGAATRRTGSGGDTNAPAHMSGVPIETASIDVCAISPTDAVHALWFFADGDAAISCPGSFTEHLLTAMVHADSVNRPALAAAFPGLAAAIALATQEIGGIAALTEIAAAGARTGGCHIADDACDQFDSAEVTGEV